LQSILEKYKNIYMSTIRIDETCLCSVANNCWAHTIIILIYQVTLLILVGILHAEDEYRIMYLIIVHTHTRPCAHTHRESE